MKKLWRTTLLLEHPTQPALALPIVVQTIHETRDGARLNVEAKLRDYLPGVRFEHIATVDERLAFTD